MMHIDKLLIASFLPALDQSSLLNRGRVISIYVNDRCLLLTSKRAFVYRVVWHETKKYLQVITSVRNRRVGEKSVAGVQKVYNISPETCYYYNVCMA